MQHPSSISPPASGSGSGSAAAPAVEEAANAAGERLQPSQILESLAGGDFTESSAALLLHILVPGLAALVAVISLYLVAKLVSRGVTSVLCERCDQTLGVFGGRLSFYSLMTLGGLAILQTLGVGVTMFAALLGALGLAIGLAFQGTLSNFAAGVLLLVFRPFKVGDFVNTAGVMGKVNAIDLFTTTFDTPDNRRLIVPNSSIAGATIENISFHPERRVEVIVGVDYSADLELTRKVLVQCAESLAELTVHGPGRGYTVILQGLSPSSVDWKVRLWTASANFFITQEALTERIKRGLDQHGIRIPFPQMQLHFAAPVPPLSAMTARPSEVEPRVQPAGELAGAEETAQREPAPIEQTHAPESPALRLPLSASIPGAGRVTATRRKIRPRSRTGETPS